MSVLLAWFVSIKNGEDYIFNCPNVVCPDGIQFSFLFILGGCLHAVLHQWLYFDLTFFLIFQESMSSKQSLYCIGYFDFKIYFLLSITDYLNQPCPPGPAIHFNPQYVDRRRPPAPNCALVPWAKPQPTGGFTLSSIVFCEVTQSICACVQVHFMLFTAWRPRHQDSGEVEPRASTLLVVVESDPLCCLLSASTSYCWVCLFTLSRVFSLVTLSFCGRMSPACSLGCCLTRLKQTECMSVDGN